MLGCYNSLLINLPASSFAHLQSIPRVKAKVNFPKYKSDPVLPTKLQTMALQCVMYTMIQIQEHFKTFNTYYQIAGRKVATIYTLLQAVYKVWTLLCPCQHMVFSFVTHIVMVYYCLSLPH